MFIWLTYKRITYVHTNNFANVRANVFCGRVILLFDLLFSFDFDSNALTIIRLCKLFMAKSDIWSTSQMPTISFHRISKAKSTRTLKCAHIKLNMLKGWPFQLATLSSWPKKLTFESMNRLCEHLRIQITVILEEYTGCLAYFGMHLLMAFYRWFAQIHPSIHEPLSSARRLYACKLSLLAQLTTDRTTLFPNGTLFRKIRIFLAQRMHQFNLICRHSFPLRYLSTFMKLRNDFGVDRKMGFNQIETINKIE